MKLDKQLQQTLISRLEQLSEEEAVLLRDNVPPEVAELFMYKILPELDFLFMSMTPMKEREYSPEKALDGEPLQEALMAEGGAVPPPPQGPEVGGLGELQNVGNPQGGLA